MQKPTRPVFRWMWIGALLLAVLGVIIPRLAREVQRHRIETEMARFEAHPSQQGIDRLSRLLATRAATKRQGERLLELLLYPRAVVRSAYPIGQLPVFSLEHPFHVSFPHADLSHEAELWIDGASPQRGSSCGGNFVDTSPLFYFLASVPQEPGVCDVEVRWRYGITWMASRTGWSGPSLSGPLPWSLLPQRTVRWSPSLQSKPDYTCSFTIPVRIQVVERQNAERIDLLSHPDLDRRMRGAFTVGGTLTASGTYDTPAGKRRYTCNTSIVFTSLPSPVAFRAALRLPNGTETALRDEYPRQYQARAGTSGIFAVRPAAPLLEETGRRQATLILTADPNQAYSDPAIKAIWNGTLELPISFEIDADAPPGGPPRP